MKSTNNKIKPDRIKLKFDDVKYMNLIIHIFDKSRIVFKASNIHNLVEQCCNDYFIMSTMNKSQYDDDKFLLDIIFINIKKLDFFQSADNNSIQSLSDIIFGFVKLETKTIIATKLKLEGIF